MKSDRIFDSCCGAGVVIVCVFLGIGIVRNWKPKAPAPEAVTAAYREGFKQGVHAGSHAERGLHTRGEPLTPSGGPEMLRDAKRFHNVFRSIHEGWEFIP